MIEGLLEPDRSNQWPQVIFYSDSFQTGPNQNTPAFPLIGQPSGWQPDIGSWCCGRGPPHPSGGHLVCWCCHSAEQLPLRTWGWRTEGCSLQGGYIRGSWTHTNRRMFNMLTPFLNCYILKSHLMLQIKVMAQLNWTGLSFNPVMLLGWGWDFNAASVVGVWRSLVPFMHSLRLFSRLSHKSPPDPLDFFGPVWCFRGQFTHMTI